MKSGMNFHGGTVNLMVDMLIIFPMGNGLISLGAKFLGVSLSVMSLVESIPFVQYDIDGLIINFSLQIFYFGLLSGEGPL